jgi:hypothetical protein
MITKRRFEGGEKIREKPYAEGQRAVRNRLGKRS